MFSAAQHEAQLNSRIDDGWVEHTGQGSHGPSTEYVGMYSLTRCKHGSALAWSDSICALWVAERAAS